MKNPARKTWFAALGMLLLLLISLAAAACAPATYTLTFVTNGAAEIAPITAEAGAEITPPEDPVRDDGAAFEGWYTSADFSGEAVEIPSTMPAENITYYAKFAETATATLTLDAGDYGTIGQTTYELSVGESVLDFVSDIAPTPASGLTFAGWYVGNTILGAALTMPAAGLTLNARYTVPYTVEVYLQTTPGGEDYEPSQDTPIEGGSGLVGSVVDLADSLGSAVTGYRLNETRSEAITLGADSAQNVYKAYFDIQSITVYYISAEPDGATVNGEMANSTFYYGMEGTLSPNAYSLTSEDASYRFAGWALSQGGAVEYTNGESATFNTNADYVILYAVWNRSIADYNGGSDLLYVLQEEPNTILLERQGLEDKEGGYDATQRTFWFGNSYEDNDLPRGRVSADGTTFTYFYSDVESQIGYTRYDWEGDEAPVTTGERLVLDGVDGATYYTNSDDTEGTPGTYVSAGSDYLFTSEAVDADGDPVRTFHFQLGTYTPDEGEAQDVFLISDGAGGTYYYYLNGNLSFPALILDGYGSVTYVQDMSSNPIYGTYEIVLGIDETYVYFILTFGEQELIVCPRSVSDTSTGTSYMVYEVDDGLRGDYTITTDEGTWTLELDGFSTIGSGRLKYTFAATGSETATDSGTVAYSYLASYTDDGVNYAGFVFATGTSVNPIYHFVLCDLTADTAKFVNDEIGTYTEYNSTSGLYTQLLLNGKDGAVLSVMLTDGTYLPALKGTYTAIDADNRYYRFALNSYVGGDTLKDVRTLLEEAYGSFNAWIGTINETAVYIISDGLNGKTFDFTIGEGETLIEYSLSPDGMWTAELEQQSGSAGTSDVNYIVMEGYSDGTHDYDFLLFEIGDVTYALRIDRNNMAGTTIQVADADIFDSTSDYVNLSVYFDYATEYVYYDMFDASGLEGGFATVGEQLRIFPDGHAIIQAEADGALKIIAEGTITTSGIDDVYGRKLLTFTVSEGGTGYDTYYQNFSFCYLYGVDSSYNVLGYFLAYTSEYAGKTVTIDGDKYTLTGYGIAQSGTNYYYTISQDESENWWITIFEGNSSNMITARLADGWQEAEIALPIVPFRDEAGTYATYVDETTIYELDLDGYGAATLYAYNTGTGELSAVATGTYEHVTEGDYYIVTWSGWDDASFTRFIVDDEGYFYMYVNEEGAVTYTFADGSTLVHDAYDRVLYTAGGVTQDAAYSVQEVGGNRYLTFYLYVTDEEGTQQLQRQGVYRIDADNKLTAVMQDIVGTYGLFENGSVTNGSLVLNGFGRATYTPADGSAVTGTVVLAETSTTDAYVEYIFTQSGSDSPLTFRFILAQVSAGNTTVNTFVIYEEKNDYEIVKDDWSYLTADGYMNATYVDYYGVVYSGNYAMYGDILYLYSSSVSLYLKISGTGTDRTFERYTEPYIVYENVLVGYQGNGGAVTIPEAVTSIADSVFMGRTDITSVDLNDVTTIGAYAFANCTALTSVTGGSVITIGAYAFAATALTSFTGDSVQTIGDYAFAYCYALASASFGTSLTAIGEGAFTIVEGGNAVAFSLTIAATGAPTLGADAFANRTGLTVYVPSDSVSAYQAAEGWLNYAESISAIAGTETADGTDSGSVADPEPDDSTAAAA